MASLAPSGQRLMDPINSKFETNPNFKYSNVQNGNPALHPFWSFEFLSLNIVSDFALRISDFDVLPK